MTTRVHDSDEVMWRKIVLRLIPYIYVCYLLNYLDRVNIGFAKLSMLGDLGMSETAYGLGAGIFFVGYIACGVPSNLTLRKIGARRWIATLMVLWGVFSTALMFTTDAVTFCVLRLLLGAAEAGFFPGLVLTLARWFPSARRGRIMALFMSAVPISGVVGGPISGWMLSHFAVGQAGLASWQWLFLLQGVPTILLGVGLLFILEDDPTRAKWLSPNERERIADLIAEDERASPPEASNSLTRALRDPGVWRLGAIYFCIQCGTYAINFWMPSIIKNSGLSDPAVIGWLSAVPYLAAAVFMLVVGRSADRRRERRYHLAVPMLMGGGGLVIAAVFANAPALALLGLTLAAMGALTSLPMTWPLTSGYLSAAAAAGGVALINSIGQVAGFVSPYMVGWVKDATHSTDAALFTLAGIMVFGAFLVLSVPARRVNR